MTEQQRQRANEIAGLLLQKTEHMEAWKKCTYFRDDIHGSSPNINKWFHLKREHIPFDVVQALVVKKYEQEIAALQEEFNNL